MIAHCPPSSFSPPTGPGGPSPFTDGRWHDRPSTPARRDLRPASTNSVRPSVQRLLIILGLWVTGFLPACSQYIDPHVPEPIRPFVEPEFSSDYLLYRPSSYNRDFAWPLVIVVHGGFPDSPNARLRAWTQLAEAHGFLVAAPTFQSPRSGWLTRQKETQQRLRNDERRILSVIRHVRAGHHISDDRILLCGYGRGAEIVLFAGVSHPDFFRALAVSRPSLDESLLTEAASVLDHDQPILVHFDVSDSLTGKHAQRCLDWLRSRGANVTEDPHGGVVEADAGRAVDFFRDVLRSHPWIRVRAFPTGGINPLEIRFKMRTSLTLSRHQWDFGDGQRGASPDPVHTYLQNGTYRVVVTVEDADGKSHRRAVTLKLPEAVVSYVSEKED